MSETILRIAEEYFPDNKKTFENIDLKIKEINDEGEFLQGLRKLIYNM